MYDYMFDYFLAGRSDFLDVTPRKSVVVLFQKNVLGFMQIKQTRYNVLISELLVSGLFLTFG